MHYVALQQVARDPSNKRPRRLTKEEDRIGQIHIRIAFMVFSTIGLRSPSREAVNQRQLCSFPQLGGLIFPLCALVAM